MKKALLPLMLLTIVSLTAVAENRDSTFTETEIILTTNTGQLFGTLTIPANFTNKTIALFIAGSGATDRDCNSPVMKNDAYKKLAHQLAEKNIASVRYDKRGIAASQAAGKNESSLRFDNYIDDAKEWIALLRKDKRFKKIIVIGHSEGSLIGMIAARNADKYISIAGPGQSADKILKIQLGAQIKAVQDLSFPIIDSLKSGKTVDHINPMLNSLFRPSVQPYMISWFKYDPAIEIKQLKIPVLIAQGTTDLQVSVDDAEELSKANPSAQLVLIKDMNHIFRIVSSDRTANLKTYNDAALPISDDLVNTIVRFIQKK